MDSQTTSPVAPDRPLTPPDEDHTPFSSMISLALPRELVERILLLLADIKSILKCRLVNREFDAIIQSSTLVQYYLACTAAGVTDNPRSSLSYAERLEALKKREDAWRELKPVFETTIRIVDYQVSLLHRLTAGNYFLRNKNRKDLYHCHLPSSPHENPQWSSIPGNGPGQSLFGAIVDMGMAVYEHDLVVNVISSEVGNQADMQRHSLDLVLLKVSTGEYHPLARHPLIHVQRSPSAKPYANVRIVGDHIALAVHDQDGSKLFVFDWKTGHKRLQHKATEDAYRYSIIVFVSAEILLVPNRILSHFEVWQLFPSHPNPKPPIQILCLKIPAVSDHYFIIHMCCHGELNPFLHSMPYFPSQPFFPSSENSIIIVNFLLESLPGFRRTTYKLVLHRRALLDMIQKWTSPLFLEQQEGLPTSLTNEATLHKIAGPDDGSIRLGTQSELVSTMPHPPATSSISVDPSSSVASEPAFSTCRYDILRVQWADWGPSISRWFQLNGTYTRWIPQSTGQRYVFLDPDPRDNTKWMVSVADFNPYNVRRNGRMMAQLEDEQNSSNRNNGEGKKEEKDEELELWDHKGVFLEKVYMGLKCVVYHAPFEYDFGAILMDEARLLGLKHDDEERVESIKVLYFG